MTFSPGSESQSNIGNGVPSDGHAPGPSAPTPPKSSSPKTQTPTRPGGPFAQRLRRISASFEESDFPAGFLAATGSFASSVASSTQPSRRRNSSANQLSGIPGAFPGTPAETPLETDEHPSMDRAMPMTLPAEAATPPGVAPAGHAPARDLGFMAKDGGATPTTDAPIPSPAASGDEKRLSADYNGAAAGEHTSREPSTNTAGPLNMKRSDTQPFDNGYHFPPSHGFVGATKLGALALWKFFLTPFGFCVVVYFLLIVAWGGMIFLIMCNAAPAMCYPDCNDIESPRRKWIEYCSQILNGLFCVTGFGLAPWRFRDLYHLMLYRVRGDLRGLRRLAGTHRRWFRLPGSQDLPVDLGPENIEASYDEATMGPSVPLPVTSIARAPLTGERAPPTKLWKMDFMVWSNVWNTIWQTLLAAFMWGYSRYDRPPWASGTWVALALGCAIAAGVTEFKEGKRVKSVEGVELSDADEKKLAEDRERNIPHYNNYKDKKPKPEDEEKQ